MTPASLFAAVTQHYAEKDHKPFTNIIVDEAQDLGVPELRFLAGIAPDHPNALFFAGDLGQRIFQPPFSWKGLGVDVRGRSSTLKVNYRTSHQIRTAADRLLPKSVRDVDGLEDGRAGTVSVFNGPAPQVLIAKSAAEEEDGVAAFIRTALGDGIDAAEIGLFVRSRDELPRARAVAAKAGVGVSKLSGRVEGEAGRIAIGTMLRRQRSGVQGCRRHGLRRKRDPVSRQTCRCFRRDGVGRGLLDRTASTLRRGDTRPRSAFGLRRCAGVRVSFRCARRGRLVAQVSNCGCAAQQQIHSANQEDLLDDLAEAAL
jgi:hypothetical protein